MSETARHVLRATQGRHAGSVYVIQGPMVFGRASHADVQILDDGVSRQHARLRIESDGSVVLMDLASTSGTWVAGRRIERATIRPGQTIQIGNARFVYELRHGDLMTSPSFVHKTSSMEAMHRTRPGVDEDLVPPVFGSPPAPPAGTATVGPPSTTPTPTPGRVVFRPPPLPSARAGGAGNLPIGSAPRGPLTWDPPPEEPPEEPPAQPAPATVDERLSIERDDSVLELVSLFGGAPAGGDPSGAPAGLGGRDGTGRFSLHAEGGPAPTHDLRDVVDRLLLYHDLAAQVTQGLRLDEPSLGALSTLESEFRTPTDLPASRREWRRFRVDARADAVWFRNLASRSVSIHLEDISAAGLRFRSDEVVFANGDVLSVVIDIPGDGRQAVFSGRVAWVSGDGDVCGAMFVGPGSWQPR